MTAVECIVIPNSRKESITYDAGRKVIIAKLRERPEKGRANRELISALSKLLGCGVSIVKGSAGRRKVLEIEASLEEVERRLGGRDEEGRT